MFRSKFFNGTPVRIALWLVVLRVVRGTFCQVKPVRTTEPKTIPIISPAPREAASDLKSSCKSMLQNNDIVYSGPTPTGIDGRAVLPPTVFGRKRFITSYINVDIVI